MPQTMYDYLLKLGTWALLALTAICIISSGAQFNGTTYHLGEKEVQVIVPVNASQINLTISEKTANMTLFDETGKNVSFNSSYRFWRGDNIYSLVFERPITGRLIYTMHLQGQQFILPIRDHSSVRIILPAGFTTGERGLGIARPQPPPNPVNSVDHCLEALQRQHPDLLRGRLCLEDHLLLRERVDALTFLRCGLLDDLELDQARHREVTSAAQALPDHAIQ